MEIPPSREAAQAAKDCLERAREYDRHAVEQDQWADACAHSYSHEAIQRQRDAAHASRLTAASLRSEALALLLIDAAERDA